MLPTIPKLPSPCLEHLLWGICSENQKTQPRHMTSAASKSLSRWERWWSPHPGTSPPASRHSWNGPFNWWCGRILALSWWENFWLVVSTIFNPSEKYESQSVGMIIPNIWKVIKFHGSKPPTCSHIWLVMVNTIKSTCFDVFCMMKLTWTMNDHVWRISPMSRQPSREPFLRSMAVSLDGMACMLGDVGSRWKLVLKLSLLYNCQQYNDQYHS